MFQPSVEYEIIMLEVIRVTNGCVVDSSNACAEAYENYATNPKWGGLINRDDHRGMFSPNELGKEK